VRAIAIIHDCIQPAVAPRWPVSFLSLVFAHGNWQLILSAELGICKDLVCYAFFKERAVSLFLRLAEPEFILRVNVIDCDDRTATVNIGKQKDEQATLWAGEERDSADGGGRDCGRHAWNTGFGTKRARGF
jgi:hypothetical protein